MKIGDHIKLSIRGKRRICRANTAIYSNSHKQRFIASIGKIVDVGCRTGVSDYQGGNVWFVRWIYDDSYGYDYAEYELISIEPQ